jgi:hypothetical protein
LGDLVEIEVKIVWTEGYFLSCGGGEKLVAWVVEDEA